MITLDDLRAFAARLPQVEESTHFGLPSFKVAGKPFAGLEKDRTTAIVSVSQADAATAVAEDAEAYEEVWRKGKGPIFVGLRIDLAKVPADRVRELVKLAWRNKAPKRVVAAYDRGES